MKLTNSSMQKLSRLELELISYMNLLTILPASSCEVSYPVLYMKETTSSTDT